ncbi:MAG: diacylglycerol kinase [Tenericutes bacterium]|jgi:diacylglycerol kinase|nr:diacylglycerol kinase [Mycoplasmatota bacterium]
MGLRGKKEFGIKRFFKSFKYSIEGLDYAYKNEQSMFIHFIAILLVTLTGFFLKINTIEWLFCICMFGIIMGAELLNTAIEAVVDMVMPDIHPLAKIAKDTASAAVFVLSIMTAIVGLIIFLPKIFNLLGWF